MDKNVGESDEPIHPRLMFFVFLPTFTTTHIFVPVFYKFKF